MNKFEQLLDYIVNEEKEKAEELFHEIVVEKSRSIYENLIAEEAKEEEEDDEEEMDEAKEEDSEEDEEDLEEMFGMEDDGEDEGEDGEMGGDATDDFVDATADHDGAEGEEAGEEGAASAEDVQDLADALEELKAEFEKLMAGEKHEEEENPDIHGGNLDSFGDDGKPMDDEEGDDEDEDEDEGMNRMESRSNVREYTEKVGQPYGSGNGISNKSEQGDGKAGPINANPKNRPSGGNVSAHNIAQGQTASDSNIKGGEGLVGGVKGKFTSPNTHNVDGVKSGIKTVTKQGAGYPGNNKTAGPVGSGSGDKAGQTSVTSNKSVVDHKQG
jgi:hypothetical protein